MLCPYLQVAIVKEKLRATFERKGGSVREAQQVMAVTDPGDNGGGYYEAKLIRLAFHDCLKYTDGTGGCDGCLNWHNMGMKFTDQKQNKYPDVGPPNPGDNNGLRNTVEVLEAIYTVPTYPRRSTKLATSLKDSGKSRADLWSLAGITAVEYGIETNNRKCQNPGSVKGCHHLQGEPGCEVHLNSSIPFRTGRADCIPTDPDRPYIASKEEVHPNPVGDGTETVQFFKEQFEFSGQETVAIMGAHTMGKFFFKNSLFRFRYWEVPYT